jgi:hypothetical protein
MANTESLRLCAIKDHGTAAAHCFQGLASRGPIHPSHKSTEHDDHDAHEITEYPRQAQVEFPENPSQYFHRKTDGDQGNK